MKKNQPRTPKKSDFEVVDAIVKHSTAVLDEMHRLTNDTRIVIGKDASDYLVSELLREMKGVENYVEEFCFRQYQNREFSRKNIPGKKS